jgi:hypothetical protein
VSCSEVRNLIGGYVLNALEPDEAAAVRAHVAGCPDCAREHEELAPVAALLDAARDPDAAPAEPPATLEDAVVDRFARERSEPEAAESGPARGSRSRGGRPRARLARPLPAAAAGALAAAAITFAAMTVLGGDDEAPPPKSYGAHLRAVDGGASGHGPDPAPAGDRPYAYAKLATTPTGTSVELKAGGLAARPGTVYELWCVYPDGSKVSGGTFRAGPDGRVRASMTTAAKVGDYHRLTVEQRRPGARGRAVLAGDIEY